MPELLETRRRNREIIRRILKWYRKKFPIEYAEVIEHCQECRTTLHRSNAMSNGKTMLKVAEIPQRVNGCMSKIFGPDWSYDQDTWEDFLSEAPLFRINTTTRNRVDAVREGRSGDEFFNPWEDVLKEVLRSKGIK